MKVKRFEEAEVYEAPNHWGVTGLRLQGFEDGGAENQWMGLSQFLPGGGAGPDATPLEKLYFIVEGEMTVTTQGKDTVLRKFDSCTIPAGQERKSENRSNHVCKMLVVMPYPPGA
jgi:mannose-6-phosphate isomerase-like protein (cupin superfamily)